ncbi:MAG: flavin reductase family protein [Oligoflexia bacterium]|nr:flavin reductase family protein [Oligoflexia bacterium]
MKKVSIDPTTILHPHPVLIIGTYGSDGTAAATADSRPNIMNAAWGGICCSNPPCVAISLREATLTYHNILHNKAFTVNIPSKKYVEIADYVGIVSGRDRDKFKDTGLTPIKSEKVNAPLVAEFPFSLECKLFQHHNLGLHTIFIGEIVGIKADESVLGPKGLPDIEKTEAILWGGMGSNHYYAIGEKLVKAFSAGKNIKLHGN